MARVGSEFPGFSPAAFGPDKTVPYRYLKRGRIMRVDNERMLIDVWWLDGHGGRTEIPISSPFFTPRSQIVGLPEVDSVVICGFSEYTQQHGNPQIVGYLPAGFKQGLNYDPVQEYTTGGYLDPITARVDEIEGYTRILRTKYRKLYPGEIYLSSTHGSEIILDKSILLSNSRLNEIELRAYDQSISLNSVNNYMNTNAARFSSGLAVRNNEDGLEVSRAPVKSILLPDGRKSYIVTEEGSERTIDDKVKAFTEVRMEVREKALGILDVTENVSGYDVDNLQLDEDNLIVEHVVGTYIGNNPSSETYGLVLERKLFGKFDDPVAEPFYSIVEGIPDKVRAGENNLSSLYHVRFPKTGRVGEITSAARGPGTDLGLTLIDGGKTNITALDVNKEGKIFVVVGASSSLDPLGAGRSIESSFDGCIKAVVGKSADQQESIRINTAGKVVLDLGEHSDENLSLDLSTENTIECKVGGNKIYEIAGSDRRRILSNEEKDIYGRSDVFYRGDRSVFVGESLSEDFHGEVDRIYVDTLKESILSDHDVEIHGRKRVTCFGPKEDIISSGESKTISGKKETLVVENVSEYIGNFNFPTAQVAKKIYALMGDYQVEIKNAGSEKHKINLGQFLIQVITGDITLEALAGKIDLNSGVEINLTSSIGNFNIATFNANGTSSLNFTYPLMTLVGTVKVIGTVILGSIIEALKLEVKISDLMRVISPVINLESSQISLGVGASEKIILGELFKILFNAHTHVAPGQPPTSSPFTGPPVIASNMTDANFSTVVKLK